jgi:tetraacyldisaccharide 4'-kinase
MFSNWFLKSFRILLLPFAILFWLLIKLRNWAFSVGIFKSVSFGLPLICVGNLSVGGTGKSPMVEYLVLQLMNRYKIATLSRGYKRKTKGYAIANPQTTAIDIGDEPMQFHKKFPEVPVAVGEERIVAIPQLLHDRPDTEVIILDDAFQHRAIKSGFNIVLTDFNNLYTRDFFLPTGDLRDTRQSAKRAQVIIVTKCNPSFSTYEKEEVIKELNPLPHQHVFFSSIIYGKPYHITDHTETDLDSDTDALLITGIAKPRHLKNYLEERIDTYYMMQYGDHHIFSIDDWKDIVKKFDSMDADKKIIITTEKDAMRLLKFETEIGKLPLYVLPIHTNFLFDEGNAFNDLVFKFIENFKPPD